MAKEKIKVYTYTRVSTAMQIDGYSLDAQKSRMKAFAEFNDYEIAHEYEDAGKSGKSIEGRTQFNQMMEDIKTGKDGVSFVLVFKLSRFGRNAADVLSTLQVMQDFGVNLICVEDGIDSSKDAGKLMISVLSAVAEIERENIRVQTMEGRIQKAREGKWNGGFAPYGYKLVDGKLEINEEEAPAIRTIYEQYVTTDSGANGIAKYLENHGISKVQRQNGKNPLFDARLIRMILKNPVYCGKIRWQYRKEEKSLTDGIVTTHRRENPDCIIAQGLHPALISEEEFEKAQQFLNSRRIPHKKESTELRNPLSGLVYCGMCGSMMTRLGTGSRNHSDTLRCPNRNCGNVSAKLELVESALVEGVARWLNDCRVNVSRKPAADTAKAERTAADKVRAELAKLDSQRERIYLFLEQGVYSAGEFRERMESLEKRRTQLSENLRQAEQAVSEAEGNRQLYAQIIPSVERVMDIYAQSTPEEKNRLLKTIISRAEYIKMERNTRGNADRCNFTLNVTPLFPETD